MSDETRDVDEYWRGIVEGLHEQIRDLEWEIRTLNEELDAAASRESYDGSY